MKRPYQWPKPSTHPEYRMNKQCQAIRKATSDIIRASEDLAKAYREAIITATTVCAHNRGRNYPCICGERRMFNIFTDPHLGEEWK